MNNDNVFALKNPTVPNVVHDGGGVQMVQKVTV